MPSKKSNIKVSKQETPPDLVTEYVKKAVLAYGILCEATEFISHHDVSLLASIVSINVEGEPPRVVVMSHPVLEKDELKGLLEAVGQESEYAATQAQSVISAAIELDKKMSSLRGKGDECSECPDREVCLGGCSCEEKQTIN
jgi:hypothetical protein